VDFPLLVTTAGLVNNALSSLKSARELAKIASDADLKETIGEAYESLLDLRERVLTLDEENRQLKAQLAAKAAYVGPVAPHGYFYVAEDGQQQHPLCPTCFQSNPQQIGFMTDAKRTGGGVRRRCKLCSKPVDESPVSKPGPHMVRIRQY
jgi:hypothetical protein